MIFGEFCKQKRIEKGFTLRAFCSRYQYEPSTISKLENGKMLPPESEDKLAAYAIALGIEKGSSDWVTYFDLAAIAKQELPKEVRESAPEIISLLPAFLRTNGNRKISDEKLQKLIDFLSSN